MEIVDGSQRIRTMAAYLNDELELKYLEKLTELNKTKFSQLSSARQRMFKNIAMSETSKMNLDHVTAFEKERAAAKITGDAVSPKVLPSYTHGNKEFEKEFFPGASK